ncbi:hypothetical protein WJX82_010168 [Trebouxia sp. C0006]
MANTQGFNPLFWHDDDLLLLEDIANSHSLLPDLPSQESHAAQPATSSSGAPSLARPSSPIIPDAPVQQRAASTAAVQRLQKMNRGYQKRYKEKQKTSSHAPSIIHVAWKPPKFIDDHIMGQLLRTPWTTSHFIACTLPEEQEAACQQVARLPRQQLATVVRVYIQEMAACVLQTGQDADSRAGLRLQRLFMEFCCLYCVKARVDPREWRSMLKDAVRPEDSGPVAASQTTDYAMIANLMQFTEAQKAGITQMHTTYELAACHEQLDDVPQKLQMCALDENQFLLYQQTSLAVKVDVWQSAVASVHCFPACPDVVAHSRWLTEAQAAGTSQKVAEPLAPVQRCDSHWQHSLHSYLQNKIGVHMAPPPASGWGLPVPTGCIKSAWEPAVASHLAGFLW